MGQAGCPGREPDCLKPAGAWVGVSARMYNDLNSLGDGQRRVTEPKAGTQEQGRECALAYMWQIHKQTGPTMDAEARTGTVKIYWGRGLTPE